MVIKRAPKTTGINSDDWLTPREVAEYLRAGVDLIYDACATGGLKHVKLGHRTIRVRRVWVDARTEAHLGKWIGKWREASPHLVTLSGTSRHDGRTSKRPCLQGLLAGCFGDLIGRGERIRTSDPSVPNRGALSIIAQ